MTHALSHLSTLTYPGRMIILGRDRSGSHDVVVYAITGRSPSSQARRLVLDGDAIWTRPTDPEVLKKGNPDLLVYPAVILGRRIAVSNGRQTADIFSADEGSAVRILETGLAGWSYEPDAPIFTPRISGCLPGSNYAGLSLLGRSEGGATERSFFEFPLEAGRGKMIATYAGENRDPVPAFRGEPLDFELGEATARAAAEAVYAALGPRGGDKDFRVAVACVFTASHDLRRSDIAILNRDERESG
jgi:IMP cyclohydrolase